MSFGASAAAAAQKRPRSSAAPAPAPASAAAASAAAAPSKPKAQSHLAFSSALTSSLEGQLDKEAEIIALVYELKHDNLKTTIAVRLPAGAMNARALGLPVGKFDVIMMEVRALQRAAKRKGLLLLLFSTLAKKLAAAADHFQHDSADAIAACGDCRGLFDCAEHSKRVDQCDECTVLLLDSLRVAQESSREPFVERQQQLDKIFAAAVPACDADGGGYLPRLSAARLFGRPTPQ